MKSQTLQAASEIITKRLASLFPKPVQPENVSMTNLSKFISEGMVEAAHKEFHRSWRADPDKACSVLKRHIKAALLAALEHAVKEGEAREALGIAWTDLSTGATGITADTAHMEENECFPALIIRGGKDGR